MKDRNDIRTFHLRLSRAEYEELERLQETVNKTMSEQYTKSEIIKMALNHLSNLSNYSCDRQWCNEEEKG